MKSSVNCPRTTIDSHIRVPSPLISFKSPWNKEDWSAFSSADTIVTSLQVESEKKIGYLNKKRYYQELLSTPALYRGIWDHGVKRHFQQYFSYIAPVRFIGGGNRSTCRKPPLCRKSLTNFIT
jgi:hypothetical protein